MVFFWFHFKKGNEIEKIIKWKKKKKREEKSSNENEQTQQSENENKKKMNKIKKWINKEIICQFSVTVELRATASGISK